MADLNLEMVKGFLESNKDNEEVKQFTQSFINSESVESFLGSDEGKKILQPRLDKHFTKGLETWKSNNLQSLIDAEINKKFPPETEEQKQLRAMQQKLDAIEKEKTIATIKAEAIKELTSKGLPVAVADYFVTDNLESTRDRINTFADEFANAVKAEVDNRLKTMGGTPKNHGSGDQQGTLTKDQLLEMDYNERVKIYNENPDEYHRIMKG